MHRLRVPRSQVRAIALRVGGGFGAKSEATVQPIAALLSMQAGRPVKVTLDREDDMIMMRSRHPARIQVKIGVRKDGTFLASITIL